MLHMKSWLCLALVVFSNVHSVSAAAAPTKIAVGLQP